MHTENTILIRAPLEQVFGTAADLPKWPEILPHYRSVVYLQRSPERTVIRMAARRGWIPIRWTSELEVDRSKHEIRFRHLKAFTRGMVVVWTFKQTGDQIRVTIRHDLNSLIPIVGGILEAIIGRFFITHVAGQTLTHMKRFLEGSAGT